MNKRINMKPQFSIYEGYLYNLEVLNVLSSAVFSTYQKVKTDLATCKSFGVSIVGNQLYTIENQLIKLNYLILQQITNCEIYRPLLHKDINDTQLEEQLNGLYLMTFDFQKEFHQLSIKLDNFNLDLDARKNLSA